MPDEELDESELVIESAVRLGSYQDWEALRGQYKGTGKSARLRRTLHQRIKPNTC